MKKMINNQSVVSLQGDIISYEKIVRVEYKDEKTIIVLDDHSTCLSVLSIDHLEWELPQDVFWRVHPKHLINRNYSGNLYSVSSKWLELHNGEKIPVSNQLVEDENEEKMVHRGLLSGFKKWLGKKS